MIRPKSLQQRLSLFMILPVAVLLILMGGVGFFHARNLLLAQWQEAAILKLQRAAHQIDMLLGKIKVRIEGLDNAAYSDAPQEVFDWTVERLEKVEGVDGVTIAWKNGDSKQIAADRTASTRMQHMGRLNRTMGSDTRLRMMRFERAQNREISPPRFDAQAEHQTMSLIYDLLDEKGRRLGSMEVVVKFDFLIKNIVETGWWHSNKAFLVENTGKILVCTVPGDRKLLGETNDPLEVKTLEAMASLQSGTIMGRGYPPTEVSGFYTLNEAPWAIVLIAPGEDILASIVHFRTFYLIFITGFIVFILFLIRFVSGKTVTSIKAVSRAADRVANGDYNTDLTTRSQDEVGGLIHSFNKMVAQLKERTRMKEAMGLAMEVQQNLLPQASLKMGRAEIAGKSIYCEETGGDYFDFLPMEDSNDARIGVAVGDVVGHGISSALLMTTGRALLRCRLSQPGSLAQSITDINRLLCLDTSESGSFMTLFCVMLDMSARRLNWVRAGHDPAFFYDTATGNVVELQGKGAALGIDNACAYEENTVSNLTIGQILLIGTDGIWETRNESGEMFGKPRVADLITKHASLSAEAIVSTITHEIEIFRGTAKQADDVTLIVVKIVG